MKLLLMAVFMLITSILPSKECTSTSTTSANESKYTEQYSINTNIPGHKIRIFTLITKPKASMKNCHGLKVTKSTFWGISNYINKNGSVNGNWETTYDDGSSMYGTFTGTSQTPKDVSQNSLSVGSSVITGGSGIYKNVTGYGITKTEFNPEKNYISGENTLYFTK